jgi:hypothetical protein
MWVKRFLFWTPRMLTVLFILLLSLLSLDVFGVGYSFGETLIALFMHMIPTFLVVIALVLAWRRAWLGAMLFGVLTVVALMFFGFESWIIALILLVIALLFGGEWLYKRRLSAQEDGVAA